MFKLHPAAVRSPAAEPAVTAAQTFVVTFPIIGGFSERANTVIQRSSGQLLCIFYTLVTHSKYHEVQVWNEQCPQKMVS
jgi:hypothetical protein